MGDGTNGSTVIKAVLGEDVPQPLLAVAVTVPVVPVLAIILDVVLEPLQSLGNDQVKLVAPTEVVDKNKLVDGQTGVA